MNHKKWGTFFFKLAAVSASASKDPSTKVGAVIAKGKHIVAIGFNGFAKGIKDTEERLNDRKLKLPLTIHAELNAILTAKCDLEGCAIYITHPPCIHCTSVIIQSDIAKVVFHKPNENFLSRWKDDIELSKQIMREAGIVVIEIDE
jgi:dCMP deaminase